MQNDSDIDPLFPFRIEGDDSLPAPEKPRIVSSIGYDQCLLLKDIVNLHCNGKVDLDPTYSIGNFYKSGEVPQPRLKFDLAPQIAGVKQADSRHLPLEDDSINSIIYDPPFISGVLSKGKNSIIKQRFSSMPTVKDLWLCYYESMKEFYRILKHNGVLVFKCQDFVVDHKNYFSHCEIMNQALEIGFTPKDLFILVAKNRLIQNNLKTQQHARKFHSYFWVFEKKKCKAPYGIRSEAKELLKSEVAVIGVDSREECCTTGRDGNGIQKSSVQASAEN